MKNKYEFTETISAEKIRGCYLLWENGLVVYVGQSSNIWARVGVHLTNPLKNFDGFSYCRVTGDLNNAEAELIVRYMPRMNSGLPNNSIYASSNQIKKMFSIDGWKWRKLKQVLIPEWRDYYKISHVKDLI